MILPPAVGHVRRLLRRLLTQAVCLAFIMAPRSIQAALEPTEVAADPGQLYSPSVQVGQNGFIDQESIADPS